MEAFWMKDSPPWVNYFFGHLRTLCWHVIHLWNAAWWRQEYRLGSWCSCHCYRGSSVASRNFAYHRSCSIGAMAAGLGRWGNGAINREFPHLLLANASALTRTNGSLPWYQQGAKSPASKLAWEDTSTTLRLNKEARPSGIASSGSHSASCLSSPARSLSASHSYVFSKAAMLSTSGCSFTLSQFWYSSWMWHLLQLYSRNAVPWVEYGIRTQEAPVGARTSRETWCTGKGVSCCLATKLIITILTVNSHVGLHRFSFIWVSNLPFQGPSNRETRKGNTVYTHGYWIHVSSSEWGSASPSS